MAGRKALPCQGALGSEAENNSRGWLRRVSPTVSVEGSNAKIGIFVDVAPVLSAQGEMFGQRVIGAAAVQKSTFRLGIGARHETARVAGWMEYQTAASAQKVGTKPADPEGKTYHHIGSGCVHVGLNSGKSAGRKIPLGVAIEAVVRFGSEPAVDVITVPKKKPACICCGSRDSLAVSVLGEKPRALQTDLGAAFLSGGAKS